MGQRDDVNAPDDRDEPARRLSKLSCRVIARGGDIDIKALGEKFGVHGRGPPLLGG